MKRLVWVVCVLVAVLLAVALQKYRVYERVWFAVVQWYEADQRRERSLWLPDYRVEIEGKVIEGLESDISALTYNPVRNTLITVTNKVPELIELSLDGRLLGRIPLDGLGDPEAVEYIAPHTYVVADERSQRLVVITVSEENGVLELIHGQQLTLGIDRNGNRGFEGLAYDPQQKRLFVGKESDPLTIYEVRGFPHTDTDADSDVQVINHADRDKKIFMTDLSSLTFDEQTGHLLALSDESRMVVELLPDGRPISSLNLLRGFAGLKRSIPQAEGIATDSEGNLYVVSEPNLFYKYVKPAPAQ